MGQTVHYDASRPGALIVKDEMIIADGYSTERLNVCENDEEKPLARASRRGQRDHQVGQSSNGAGRRLVYHVVALPQCCQAHPPAGIVRVYAGLQGQVVWSF